MTSHGLFEGSYPIARVLIVVAGAGVSTAFFKSLNYNVIMLLLLLSSH